MQISHQSLDAAETLKFAGAGITHGHATAYTEAHAEASGVLVRHGYRLVPHVLQASEITRETLRSLDMRRG